MCIFPPHPEEPCHLCSHISLDTITSNWERGQVGVLGLGVSAMGDPMWSKVTLENTFSLLTTYEAHFIGEESEERDLMKPMDVVLQSWNQTVL